MIRIGFKLNNDIARIQNVIDHTRKLYNHYIDQKKIAHKAKDEDEEKYCKMEIAKTEQTLITLGEQLTKLKADLKKQEWEVAKHRVIVRMMSELFAEEITEFKCSLQKHCFDYGDLVSQYQRILDAIDDFQEKFMDNKNIKFRNNQEMLDEALVKQLKEINYKTINNYITKAENEKD